MMGLSDGRKSFQIRLVVLIQYWLWQRASHPPSHPASHVAVAITLNAKASSLKIITCSNGWSVITHPIAGYSLKNSLLVLLLVQKRATKILRYCRHLNYQQRLEFLNLPTLAFRRNRGDKDRVYKILTGKYDPTLPSILHRNINSTTRGNPLKLCTYRPKYDLCKYNFRVISLWNSLPTRDHNGFSR